MKLWFQSCGPLDAEPELHKDYKESLLKHLHKVARSDTEIDLHGTKVFSYRSNYYYDVYLHTFQIIENAIQAEKSGYDAFVQTGMQDYGFYEIREAVSIPVIFPIEASLHLATMIAPKVAFLTHGPANLIRLNEKAKLYGFQDRMTAGGHLNLTPKDLVGGFKKPETIIKALAAEAAEVAKQGANILITAGNVITMILIENGVSELGGVRVLDSQGGLVKMAEMMVELHKIGFTRDNMGRYSPQPKNLLANTRSVYGVK